MKEYNRFASFVESAIGATAPTLIIAIVSYLREKEGVQIPLDLSIIIISYVISAVLIYFTNNRIARCRYFRPFKEYEGKWVQIIPGFKREIAVCTLSFDKKDGYHFTGTNFGKTDRENVEFSSHRFVKNDEGGFFFVTSSNQNNRPEGFGKIHALSKNAKGFYSGVGYFFDVLPNNFTADDLPNGFSADVHETIMIKFDEHFYNHYINLYIGEDPRLFTDHEIYEHVKEFVSDNYLSPYEEIAYL